MITTSYCTNGFADRGVEEALDAIAAAGFKNVEICGQKPHVATPLKGRELSEFRARLESRGLGTPTVHAPATVNVLGAPDETWRREKMVVLSSYIRFAADLGAKGIVVHTVPNPIFVQNASAPEIPGLVREAVFRSLDDLLPVAASSGVRILLENLAYACNYPYLAVRELRPLVDGYPEETLGINLDTGHVGTARMDPVEEIRTAGKRLWGTHLHDVHPTEPNDNHWMPTQGGLGWAGIRKALAEVEYKGAWTFEVINGSQGETPDQLVVMTHRLALSWGIDT